MKAILFILCFFVFAFSIANAQIGIPAKLCSDSIELVKSMMRQDKEFTSYGTGHGGTISKQYQRFLFLLNRLSIDEFLELSSDSSVCLRLYAYTGLVHKRHKGIKQVKSTLLSDSTEIPIMIGCGGGNVYMFAVFNRFNQWYERKSVTKLLRDQNEQKEFWYKNFVFAK